MIHDNNDTFENITSDLDDNITEFIVSILGDDEIIIYNFLRNLLNITIYE